MADEKTEQKPPQAAAEAKPDGAAPAGKDAAKGKSSVLSYIIVTVIVLICAGAGIGLGLIFAGTGKVKPVAEEPEAVAESPKAETPKKAEKGANEKKTEGNKSSKPGEIWYYDLDPVVANLNEPGATRYVRAALTLEMSPTITAEKGGALLASKKPLLINLLTIYLAGLNVDATRGDKNLKRIQAELTDILNEKIFSDSAPLIKGILIKEFAVQ